MSRRPSGTQCVEVVNPVAQGLAIHSADPRSLLAVHPVAHRCQRQQPPALVGVLRDGSEPPQARRPVDRIVQLHRSGHGPNPPRAMESMIRTAESPRGSAAAAVGISLRSRTNFFDRARSRIPHHRYLAMPLPQILLATDEIRRAAEHGRLWCVYRRQNRIGTHRPSPRARSESSSTFRA